jgi:hypothetical protein
LPLGAWKLTLAVLLVLAIFASAYARAPRQAAGRTELTRLVVAAVLLYGLGVFASLTDHPEPAGIIYGVGIGLCAFAAWLSRGSDPDGGPGDDDPGDVHPPPRPDGVPWIDWAEFERAFWNYAERHSRSGRRPAVHR